MDNKKIISQVLDSFKIGHGEIRETKGPAVTLYEFRPEIGIRMSKIRNLKDEFMSALSASSVMVTAPIPGRGTVGIEIPNENRQNIGIREILNSEEYLNTNMELPLALGKKSDGTVFMVDLATMPHLLIAGATGMGKSVGLNVILASLLNKRNPNEMKLVLIDPKQVELTVYNLLSTQYIAHLEGYAPISTDLKGAEGYLAAIIRLMEKRYSTLSEAGVRNIKEYNSTAAEKMPYYVVIIDEYGDLILQSENREFEKMICRIAQKSRAVGIHMIISTQRPDAKIVTGSIKANFPTRIAFRTTTGTDSRVILDRIGAERLIGNGDMLFYQGAEMTRCQCAYISTEEVGEMCLNIFGKNLQYGTTYLPGPEVRKPTVGQRRPFLSIPVGEMMIL